MYLNYPKDDQGKKKGDLEKKKKNMNEKPSLSVHNLKSLQQYVIKGMSLASLSHKILTYFLDVKTLITSAEMCVKASLSATYEIYCLKSCFKVRSKLLENITETLVRSTLN